MCHYDLKILLIIVKHYGGTIREPEYIRGGVGSGSPGTHSRTGQHDGNCFVGLPTYAQFTESGLSCGFSSRHLIYCTKESYDCWDLKNFNLRTLT